MALTAQEEALVRQLLDEQAAILSLASSEANILSKLGATKVTLSDLAAVSTVADADLLLMRQGTTDKSLSALIFGAYAANSVPSASQTVQGKIEIATDAEVQTGTDTVRAVTPAGLSARTATLTRTGVVELATDAETSTGTDTSRAITPANLLSVAFARNQTYQTLTGSRSIGVTYTNSTAKPILVFISATVATGQNMILTVGGVALSAGTTPPSPATGAGHFIVPPGQTYILSNANSISQWVELR